MEPVFLGSGAAYYPVLGNTGAYIRAGARLYVLDCGATVFPGLIKHGALEGVKYVTVFLSHLHADHSGSLGLLLCYCHDVLGVRPTVVHPMDDVIRLLDMTGVEKDAYTWDRGVSERLLGGMRVRFYQTVHVPEIPSFGYVLTRGDESIYYSGDAALVPEPVLERFKSGGIDRLYQDTSLAPSHHHCYYEKLSEQIPPELRSRVYCMHLDGADVSPLTRAGFSVVSSDYSL